LGPVLIPASFVGPSFQPDVTVKGSGLAGWRALGHAEWKIQNGEITGAPGQGGGWLLLDRSFQDVAVNTLVRCGEGCKSGVLLRAESTPEGMKGIFISLTPGDVAP
jgi:hypothetical protein